MTNDTISYFLGALKAQGGAIPSRRMVNAALSEAGLAIVPTSPSAQIAKAGRAFFEHSDDQSNLVSAGYAYRAMIRAAQES